MFLEAKNAKSHNGIYKRPTVYQYIIIHYQLYLIIEIAVKMKNWVNQLKVIRFNWLVSSCCLDSTSQFHILFQVVPREVFRTTPARWYILFTLCWMGLIQNFIGTSKCSAASKFKSTHDLISMLLLAVFIL